MGWTKFTVLSNAPSAGTGLKVALRKTKKAAATLSLTILPEVAKLLSWSDGDKLEVMIGEGDHHGLLRLRKNNSVGTAMVVGKKAIHDSSYFRIGLGAVPGFVDRSESARWAKFEQADEAWVEITLPLWASETAPKTAVAVRPPVPNSVAQAATFQRPKRDAAPSIMGDPPPGRSALAGR